MIHNAYGSLSGEEIMISRISNILQDYGHKVSTFFRNSSEIKTGADKRRAFFSGIYSRKSRRQFRETIKQNRPDVVHIHNLFPLISPAILPECKKASVPVVMTVHNYRLVCPSGLHLTAGKICEKCCGGREYQCLLNNCEKSLSKSLGYFLRNYVARKLKLYKNNVSMYACLTEFQKQRLIDAGFDADRLVVIPNMANVQERDNESVLGDYIGFIGRISPEKGVGDLVSAARQLEDIKFKAAGSYDLIPELLNSAPDNFEFCGHIGRDKISGFYDNSRISVMCSICYEGFPSTILEPMMQGKPVIASRIGGIPEIVDDGVTGLLFEPGNAEDLAEKIQYLWDRPELCKKMGQAGREKALREYSPKKYYERLMDVYKKTIELGPGGA